MAIDPGVLTQITEHYDKDLYQILFEDGKETSPLLACCEVKAEKEGLGRKFIQRVTTFEGAAVAADPSIADAIAADGAAGGRPTRQRWEINAVSMDSTFKFDREEILAIEGMRADEQFDVITEEMDMAALRIRNMLAEQVSGKGWGKLAVTTAQSTTGFTVNPAFTNRFPVGARLVASVSEDTDVLLGSSAQLRVIAADPATGVITVSGNPVTTWASSAVLYIFRAGMRLSLDPNGDESLKTSLTGVAGWINPTGGTMFGINRTGDPNLTGFAIDCTGLDTSQALSAMADQMFSYGRKLDTIFISGTSWKLLQNDYDASKVVKVDLGDYKIGFDGYKLATVFGSAVVIPDPYLAPGEAYGGPFQNKKWRPRLLHSGAKLVNLDNFDGKDFERVTTSGARQFKGQFFFRGQMCIAGPGMYIKASNLPTS
ncbi:MAG: hypothetical protein H0V07_12285 [Propionibacteriales bacterium]|nr:hypothetical protein [Propionibacteriales bacterium]